MRQRLNLIILTLLMELICFWPVWRWYYFRVINSPDELTGLLSIVTALFFIWLKRNKASTYPKSHLYLTIALNFTYALTYSFSPPLIRGIIAFSAIAVTLADFFLKGNFKSSIWGLFVLGLPLIPTLQFYLGFPLRWLTAFIAVPLINLSGFSISQSGACLNWSGKIVAIDAPCSGVKMLWAGLYLLLTLTTIHDFKFTKTVIALFLTTIIIILGNILRSITLFYLEAGIVPAPGWLHQVIGLIAFGFVSSFIFFATMKLKGGMKCNDDTIFS
ncbi:MAG: exosortase/archaeosortase family protein [Firmicutes bacterium]|mgnify:CR=1 FL=1|nr:exosortase/archaeosortase family protein [Bacillota bacterium]